MANGVFQLSYWAARTRNTNSADARKTVSGDVVCVFSWCARSVHSYEIPLGSTWSANCSMRPRAPPEERPGAAAPITSAAGTRLWRGRSEESRVGKGGGNKRESRWCTYHTKKKAESTRNTI